MERTNGSVAQDNKLNVLSETDNSFSSKEIQPAAMHLAFYEQKQVAAEEEEVTPRNAIRPSISLDETKQEIASEANRTLTSFTIDDILGRCKNEQEKEHDEDNRSMKIQFSERGDRAAKITISPKNEGYLVKHRSSTSTDDSQSSTPNSTHCAEGNHFFPNNGVHFYQPAPNPLYVYQYGGAMLPSYGYSLYQLPFDSSYYAPLTPPWGCQSSWYPFLMGDVNSNYVVANEKKLYRAAGVFHSR